MLFLKLVAACIGALIRSANAIAVNGIGESSNRVAYASGRREGVETEIIVAVLLIFIIGVAENLYGVFFRPIDIAVCMGNGQ